MAKTRGYTGTQKDDYTGTPGKYITKPKPKKRPGGAKAGNAARRAAGGNRTMPSRKK